MAIEKLDTIIIEDQFNLSEDVLLAEAQAAGRERALEHGWTAIQVTKSNQPVKKEGAFFCHQFDLLGTRSDQGNKNKSVTSSSANSPSNGGLAADTSPV